ncbi:hypothetical protein JCM19236_3863 [Vibrio sp. JCM 19236]|nr:hypothetical protein JCM19236_3863 [Vibrio sp. JCM 19236]
MKHLIKLSTLSLAIAAAPQVFAANNTIPVDETNYNQPLRPNT